MADLGVVTGLGISAGKLKEPARVCEPCTEGSMRKSHDRAIGHTYEVIELLHTDLAGPVNVPSLGGARYALSLVDDRSNFASVGFLKKKDEAAWFIESEIRRLETLSGRRVKFLRSDRGGEFEHRLKAVCERMGITQQKTLPDSHQSPNGVAESFNQVLFNKVRTLLAGSDLPKNPLISSDLPHSKP